MFQQPGTRYIASNKFNPLASTISLIVTMLIAMGLGRLYAIITVVNPLIYFNFILLIIVVFGLVFVAGTAQLLSGSRNKAIDVVFILVVCLTAWFSHWAHIQSSETRAGSFFSCLSNPGNVLSFIGDFADSRNMSIGRLGSGVEISPAFLGICYLIEFVAFLVPVYIVLKQKNFYCEDCRKHYQSATAYTASDTIFHNNSSAVENGNLGFLEGTPLFPSKESIPVNPVEAPRIGIIAFHFCPACGQNSIVDIDTATLKFDDKNKLETKGDLKMASSMYITETSNRILLGQLTKRTTETAPSQ